MREMAEVEDRDVATEEVPTDPVNSPPRTVEQAVAAELTARERPLVQTTTHLLALNNLTSLRNSCATILKKTDFAIAFSNISETLLNGKHRCRCRLNYLTKVAVQSQSNHSPE